MAFPQASYKKWRLSTFIGILFVSIVGSLAHFLYDWSGENFIVGLFTAVNESTWEHMKLLFFPMLLYAFLESFVIRYDERILTIHNAAVLVGTWLIPVLFYSYSGILGFNLAIFDIFTFFVSVVLAFLLRFYWITQNRVQKKHSWINLLTFLLFGCFLLFTLWAPALGIFKDPTH